MANKKIIQSKVVVSQVLHESVNADFVIKYRNKLITLPKIRKFAFEQLKFVYNTLFENLKAYYRQNGWATLTVGMVVERYLFEEFVEQLAEQNINTYKCVSYLKKKDVIGVCGAGYIFEEERLD